MSRKSMFHNLEVEMAKSRLLQNDLAKVIHVTPTTLSLKLNGKSNLSLKECLLIKQALKTEQTVEHLFATDDNPQHSIWLL